MDMKTQRIAYIGKKKVKKDNIAGTGLIWNGFGDVHDVPHGPAVKMLNHPDVWTTEKDFNARFAADLTPEPEPEPEPEPQPEPEPEPDQNPPETTAPTGEGSQSTPPSGETDSEPQPDETEKQALFRIFSQLTEDEISKHGPKMPVVRAKLGRDISVEEVKEAWGEFKSRATDAK